MRGGHVLHKGGIWFDSRKNVNVGHSIISTVRHYHNIRRLRMPRIPQFVNGLPASDKIHGRFLTHLRLRDENQSSIRMRAKKDPNTFNHSTIRLACTICRGEDMSEFDHGVSS